jgi:hypothetical protein
MITALLVGDEAVIARLTAMGPDLRRGLARAVARFAREPRRRMRGKAPPRGALKAARASALPRKGAQRFRPAGMPEVAPPARAFLRSALREMTPRIEAGLKEAVAEALRK